MYMHVAREIGERVHYLDRVPSHRDSNLRGLCKAFVILVFHAVDHQLKSTRNVISADILNSFKSWLKTHFIRQCLTLSFEPFAPDSDFIYLYFIL